MNRHTYTIILELTPLQEVVHGMGSLGNETQILTTEHNVCLDGEPVRLQVPTVSGASVKAGLREKAFDISMGLAGVESLPGRDVIRLLLKGGKTAGSSGQSVSLEDLRKVEDLFPMLSVYGSFDGGMANPGKIQVDDVKPWCAELVESGLMAREYLPTQVDVFGTELIAMPEPLRVFPSWKEPPPLAHARTHRTGYRHDLTASPAARALMAGSEDMRAIEGCRAAVTDQRKAGTTVRAEVRRDANESMPHSFQAIAPGTPLLTRITLRRANPVEWGCLLMALVAWIQDGAHLGGKSTAGYGRCTVRVAGAFQVAMPSGAHATGTGTAIDIKQPTAPQAFVEYVQTRAGAIQERVAKG